MYPKTSSRTVGKNRKSLSATHSSRVLRSPRGRGRHRCRRNTLAHPDSGELRQPRNFPGPGAKRAAGECQSESYDNGTASLLDLLRQPARSTISFNAERSRHYQSTCRCRRVQKPLIPESPSAVFRESSSVKAQKIRRLFRRVHPDSLFHRMLRWPPSTTPYLLVVLRHIVDNQR